MPDPFDEETNESTEAPTGDNQSKAFERIKAERDAAREEAKALKAEVEQGRRTSTFGELGIDRKYAELYQGEADPEAIKAWATKFGFVGQAPAPAAPEAGAPEAPRAEEQPPAAPPEQVGSPPVVGGAPTYQPSISVREYQKMILDGRTEEAAKLYNEGRVEILTGGKFTGGSNEE